MATTPENETVVRRAIQAWNDQDIDTFVACYADELAAYEGESDEANAISHEEHATAAASWLGMFPDLVESVRDLRTWDDQVFVRTRSRGTPAQPWRGLEPSGEPVEWDCWYVYRLRDGLIVEERVLLDRLGLYTAMGATVHPERET